MKESLGDVSTGRAVSFLCVVALRACFLCFRSQWKMYIFYFILSGYHHFSLL